MPMTRSDLIALCGDIFQYDEHAAPQWKDEAKWCVYVPTPEGFEHIINTCTGKKLNGIYMNRLMKDSFLAVCHDLKSEGLEKELKTYDGCFQIRNVRGSDSIWSIHSWAMALDFNAATNQLGTDGDMHPRVVEIFEKHGFFWGGKFKRKDPMHWQCIA